MSLYYYYYFFLFSLLCPSIKALNYLCTFNSLLILIETSFSPQLLSMYTKTLFYLTFVFLHAPPPSLFIYLMVNRTACFSMNLTSVTVGFFLVLISVYGILNRHHILWFFLICSLQNAAYHSFKAYTYWFIGGCLHSWRSLVLAFQCSFLISCLQKIMGTSIFSE